MDDLDKLGWMYKIPQFDKIINNKLPHQFDWSNKINQSLGVQIPSHDSSINRTLSLIAASKPAYLETFASAGINTSIPNYRNYLEAIQKNLMPPSYINAFLSLEKSMKNPTLDILQASNYLYRNFNLSELIEDYDDSDEGNTEVSAIVVSESKRIKQIITDIYKDNKILYEITPRKFEEIIAELMYQKGFEVELTKPTRDGGYDILAIQYVDGLRMPLKFLVECKNYTKRPVGVEIIRSFGYVVNKENADRGLIFTTSYFTKPAHDLRMQDPYLFEYNDKNDIIKWVDDYYNLAIYR